MGGRVVAAGAADIRTSRQNRDPSIIRSCTHKHTYIHSSWPPITSALPVIASGRSGFQCPKVQSQQVRSFCVFTLKAQAERCLVIKSSTRYARSFSRRRIAASGGDCENRHASPLADARSLRRPSNPSHRDPLGTAQGAIGCALLSTEHNVDASARLQIREFSRSFWSP